MANGSWPLASPISWLCPLRWVAIQLASRFVCLFACLLVLNIVSIVCLTWNWWTFLFFFLFWLANQKPMGKDKPVPRILQLKPDHVEQMGGKVLQSKKQKQNIKQKQKTQSRGCVLWFIFIFSFSFLFYFLFQINFTAARFSVGQDEERSIVTSTGPYVITWNFRKVKQNKLSEYQVKIH